MRLLVSACVILSIGFIKKCPDDELPGGGTPYTPPPVSYQDTITLYDTARSGCTFTFTPTSALKTDEHNETIDPAEDIDVIDVSVEYSYNCGIPGESVVTSPWGEEKKWLLRFPTSCDVSPASEPPEYLNYAESDKQLLEALSCGFTSSFYWPTSVLDYGDRNDADWASTCLAGTDDLTPYEITPLEAATSEPASSVLYADWTYAINSRYEDRTFVEWDRDIDDDGVDEPEDQWVPVYMSPCDGQSCANCADINQVKMVITIVYYR